MSEMYKWRGLNINEQFDICLLYICILILSREDLETCRLILGKNNDLQVKFSQTVSQVYQ